MSGFAALNGEPDGPPLLPPFALADGVAGLATAFAILAALRAREQTGRGQVVDTSLVEPLMTLLGPQVTGVRPARELQPRTGNRSSTTLRATSTARQTDAGSPSRRARRRSPSASCGSSEGPSSPTRPWFATGSGRAAHVDEIDDAVAAWIGPARGTRCSRRSRRPRRRSRRSTMRATSLRDPHLEAIGALRSVDDDGARTAQDDERRQPPFGDPRGHRTRPAVPTDATRTPFSASSASTSASSSASAQKASCEPPPVDLALRPGRPPRPGREGDRVARARGDRRSRGRRCAGREGERARPNLQRCWPSRARSPSSFGSTPATEADLDAVRAALAIAGVVVPKVVRARTTCRRSALPVHCLIESALGVEAAFDDRLAPRASRGSRSVRPTFARRRVRSRRVSTGRGPDRQRGGRCRSPSATAVRLPASSTTPMASRVRAHAVASSGTSGGRRSIPAQLEIIERAYLPTERRARASSATLDRLEAPRGASTARAERSSTPRCSVPRAQVIALAERYGTAGRE